MSHASLALSRGRAEVHRLWLTRAALIAVLLVSAATRLASPDWDGGIAAHPDERFLLGAVEATPWLANVCRTVQDFPYGHLPVAVARLLLTASGGRDVLYPARSLSGLVGVCLVAIAGACGRRLAGWRGQLFAASAAALSPGLIQQGHFYTADPLGAALAATAVLTATRRRWGWAGALAGLAVACKLSLAVTGLVLLMVALLNCDVARSGRGFCVRLPWGRAGEPAGPARPWLRRAVAFGLPFAVAFAVVSPWSLLTPVACWRGPLLQGMLVSGRFTFPYTQQYLHTKPVVYPLVQLALWGLGPLVTGLGLWGLVAVGVRTRRWRAPWRDPAWLCTVVAFVASSSLHVKFPRYLLPLYPWWAGWAAYGLWGASGTRWRGLRGGLAGLALVSSGVLGLAQAGLYREAHPWYAASRWVYSHVPAGATVAIEAWDHPLPVPLIPSNDGHLGGPEDYNQLVVPVYEDDSPAKASVLQQAGWAEAVILASRRGYGALSRDRDRYGESLAWYRRQLVDREVVAFARCPSVGGVAITDDPLADAGLPVPVSLAARCGTRHALRLPRLDESYRVYDAPLTLVLAKPSD